MSELIENYYPTLDDDKYAKSKKCFIENFLNEDSTKTAIPTTQTLLKFNYIRLEKVLEYINQIMNDKLHKAEEIINIHN